MNLQPRQVFSMVPAFKDHILTPHREAKSTAKTTTQDTVPFPALHRRLASQTNGSHLILHVCRTSETRCGYNVYRNSCCYRLGGKCRFCDWGRFALHEKQEVEAARNVRECRWCEASVRIDSRRPGHDTSSHKFPFNANDGLSIYILRFAKSANRRTRI